jgi:hypothetical protein
MVKKKAIVKPSSTQDISWKQHKKLLNTIKDVQLFVALAILASTLSLLILLTVVLPMNDQIDRMANDQGNLAFYQLETNQALDQLAISMNNSSPFCYGFDQYGVKGYGVDGSKVTTACEVKQ